MYFSIFTSLFTLKYIKSSSIDSGCERGGCRPITISSRQVFRTRPIGGDQVRLVRVLNSQQSLLLVQCLVLRGSVTSQVKRDIF